MIIVHNNNNNDDDDDDDDDDEFCLLGASCLFCITPKRHIFWISFQLGLSHSEHRCLDLSPGLLLLYHSR